MRRKKRRKTEERGRNKRDRERGGKEADGDHREAGDRAGAKKTLMAHRGGVARLNGRGAMASAACSAE